jgi:hypothetical protein
VEISDDAAILAAGYVPKSSANHGRDENSDLALNRDVSRNPEKCK